MRRPEMQEIRALGKGMPSEASGPPTSAGLVQFVCHAVLDLKMQSSAMTMVEKLWARRAWPKRNAGSYGRRPE